MKLNRIAFLLATVVASGYANATLLIQQGPGNFPGDENVLFNTDGLLESGLMVQGVTNNTNTVVDFLSTTSLATPAAGQARITAEDSGGTYQDLSIFFADSSQTATSLIFNVNAATDGQITFTVDQLVGPSLTETFDISANGSNWFRISAIDGQRITNTSFTTTGTITDVRQIRIGGAAAVPEPASMACLATGLLAVVSRRRKAAKR